MGLFDFFKKEPQAVREEKETVIEEVAYTRAMVQRVLALMKDTEQSYISIMVTDDRVGLLDSKFGGMPYLPKSVEIPKGEEDANLYLLAQINLEQLPKGSFPLEEGILQFWIADDDAYGLDFDNPLSQKGSRVVYYSKLEPYLSERDIVEKYPSLLKQQEVSPINGTFGLTFTSKREIVTSGDDAFDERFTREWNNLFPDKIIENALDLPDDALEDEYNANSGYGHKLLGYPAFTQGDPRSQSSYKNYRLLLQIDSIGTKTQEIMWGDTGIGNFFIRDEDLLNANFSKVMYNWDCC